MPIFKYQRIITDGPDGTTQTFVNAGADPRAVELAEVEGWRYVHVPAAANLPDQPQVIQWQEVAVDDALREQIKAASRPCALIYEEMQRRIRAAYPIEVEQYYNRIGTGAALGLYTFQPGEHEALVTYGAYVESVRQWGRAERAKLGL